MAYLVAILVSFLILVAFLVLVRLETARGFRVLSGPRKRLDHNVARASYIARHIDWGGLITHVIVTNAERAAHDLVHGVLLLVRAVERTLTRLIRSLRERARKRAPETEPVEGSHLVAPRVRFRKSTRRQDKSTTKTPGDSVE